MYFTVDETQKGLTVNFTVTGGNSITLDFGDGSSTSSFDKKNGCSHTYKEPGFYVVTATQNKGSIEIFQNTVKVGEPKEIAVPVKPLNKIVTALKRWFKWQ